jgi:hypothetical protein
MQVYTCEKLCNGDPGQQLHGRVDPEPFHIVFTFDKLVWSKGLQIKFCESEAIHEIREKQSRKIPDSMVAVPCNSTGLECMAVGTVSYSAKSCLKVLKFAHLKGFTQIIVLK